MRLAAAFARAKTGNSSPARMAITAITISNSIRVNPRTNGFVRRIGFWDAYTHNIDEETPQATLQANPQGCQSVAGGRASLGARPTGSPPPESLPPQPGVADFRR